MKAQQLNSPALSTVIDLEQVRAGSACPPLAVHVHHAGSWTILEVDREVDIQTRALITNLVGSHASRVVFDLRGVGFMDAGGLGILVGIQRTALQTGGCVRLVAPSRSVRRVLMLTGCDRVFETFDSLPRALTTPLDATLTPT